MTPQFINSFRIPQKNIDNSTSLSFDLLAERALIESHTF